ncbi:DUF1109 domain-containing protein [uncultured Oxalicibacterium sp.]|uniref:DUF1109 domain-containing protein n=1 Tax=uncultured Oxalicibacterium sp. TaxID=1168540 RepID=UPI0025F74DAD|nr:DUF1109 domain-containing protein [uncultured Oxalicibacterium sp.]
MKTDHLISLLSADVQPVPQHAAEKRMSAAIVASGAVSFAMLLTIYGLRPDLKEVSASLAYWMKMGVPLANALIALAFLFVLAHPGKRAKSGYWVLAVPVFILWGWALLSWSDAEPGTRVALLMGQTWQVCIFNIALLSLPVGLATLFALRHLAPTRPALTGAMAGWFAGSVGAGIYALHCPEMAPPFLAVWYVLGMLMPSALMAYIGSRYLKW